MADLAIEDAPSSAELLKRLSVVEKEATERVAQLEGQVKTIQSELSTLRVTPFTPTFDLPCFDPYRRPDGRVITSSVITTTEQWYEHGLLFPHEPLRRDIIEVEYLLKQHVKPNEPWKLVNFFEWYNSRFVKIVHEHHDAEEKIFFPEVKKRYTNFPEKTSADHKTLLKYLDDVADLGKKFKSLGGNDSNADASAQILPELRRTWSEMAVLMLPHLAEEEQQMLSFIKDVFNKEEMDKLTERIVKAQGITGARLFLPSILESGDAWMTEAIRENFYREVPPPIRFFLRKFWVHSYAKYHRGALVSLRAGHPKLLIKRNTFF